MIKQNQNDCINLMEVFKYNFGCSEKNCKHSILVANTKKKYVESYNAFWKRQKKRNGK